MSIFNWLIKRLETHDKVAATRLLDHETLSISRKEGEELVVYASRQDSFDLSCVKEIVAKSPADFILCLRKEAIIGEGIIDFLNSEYKVIGGYGDLFRVLNQEENWPYFPPNVFFVLRGLQQHTRVRRASRLDNKRYSIERIGLDSVVVIGLDDYDLGIEAVRNAVAKFSPFNAILKVNPNGGISADAVALAESLGIKVFTWGELLGMLHKKWE